MYKTLCVLLLCSLVELSKSASYCNDNLTLNKLPGGIKEQLLSLLINGTIYGFLGCPENTTVPEDAVKFWLFNRNNLVIPILLNSNNPIQVDPSKPTIFVIHGWVCNITDGEMPPLIAAYLQRYDCNVIGVDWSELSIATYISAYCDVPKVAQKLADFLCTLKANLNILPETVHVLGHSMGAQIAGIAGQIIKSQCTAKIKRITGLDPAKPFYQHKPISQRLDKSDAKSVDVIHTNGGILGYIDPCGHQDFFPNCGSFQPGCFPSTTSVKQLLNLPVTHVLCDHFRANVLMAYAVSSGNFTARSCKVCPGTPYVPLCPPDPLWLASRNTMGEDCDFEKPDTKYFLSTNSKPPYAQGNHICH